MTKLIKITLTLQLILGSFIVIQAMEQPANKQTSNARFILLRKALKNNNHELANHLASSLPADAVDQFGRSPLHYVDATQGVRLLLANGADVNALDINQQTPVDRALDRSSRAAAYELTRWGGVMAYEAWTILHYAAALGNVKRLKDIISRCRCVLNAQDVDGYTALHIALMQTHYDAAELLLREGADATLANHHGVASADMITGTCDLDLIRLMRQISPI